MFEPPDKIELYLRKNNPEHVHGYRMGWLTIENFEFQQKECYHIFTEHEGKKKIVGTVI